MNITDWNAIADAYFDIDDPEGRAVLTFIRDKLATLQPKRLLDYGGGDGKFAVLCADSLSLQEIVTYDPAPRMTSLARSLCADFKQIRVTESTEEIKSGTFDVVTFNAVWMCLTSREACLDTLKKIARLSRTLGECRTANQAGFTTERILPAGSLNQAIVGPFPRMIPFSSVFRSP